MSFDHSVTANDLIRDALLNCGAVDADESVGGQESTDALRTLNNMVKSWQGRFHLWTREEVVLPYVNAGNTYKLGPASTDAEWCLADDFKYTLLNGAASAAATSLTVDSTADMAVADRIGIELSDGTRQWTTVKGITSTTVCTLSTALTGAASDDATVFTYTTRPQRPVRLLHVRRGKYNGTQVPVTIEALERYFDTPNKTATGAVTLVSYKPSLTSGTLYTWPSAGSVQDVLNMTIEYPIADFDTTSDNPNFPIEWAQPIVSNLSVLLDRQYRQLDASRRREMMAQAAADLDRIERQDSDIGSIYFQPSPHR